MINAYIKYIYADKGGSQFNLSVEQQIQIDTILSMQINVEEQTQFRKKKTYLIDKKSAECFDQKRAQSILGQTVQTGDSKLEQNMDINTRRLEQNKDYRIHSDLDRTQKCKEKKTFPSFKDRNSSPIQSDKSPSEASNASHAYICLTCKNPEYLAQTCRIHSERNCKHYV